MKEKLSLIIRIVLAAVFIIFLLMGISGSGEELMSGPMITLAWVFLGIATFGAVFLDLILTVVKEPSKLKKPLIALVAVAIVFFIGYSLADGQEYVYTSGPDEIVVDGSISKFVGGALTTMYILSGVALLSILIGEVSKIFK